MQWTDIATKAFEEIKTALANTTLLVHPMSDAPINIMTDVSDMAIGGVLQQYIDGNWYPTSLANYHLQNNTTALLTENY